MNWGEIDNAWAFLAVLAVQVASLAGLFYGQHKGRAGRSEDREVIAQAAKKVDAVSAKVEVVKQDVKVVRGEVKNDHPDEQNLRDQVDRIEQAVDRLTSAVTDIGRRQIDQGRDIGGIREEMRTERKERIEGDRRRCK